MNTDAYKNDVSYKWHKLSFFISWLASNATIVLCFDVPPSLKAALLNSLSKSGNPLQIDDPFALHAVLVEDVIAFFDTVLWSWRDLIRDLELVGKSL